MEGLIGIDKCTSGTISVFSIFLFSLIAHVIIALAGGVACATVAGVSRHVEAVWVGLHHVDGLALGVIRGQSVLSAILRIKLYRVHTCNTAALNSAQVDGELDGATSEVGSECVIVAFIGALLDEHAVVVGDVNAVLFFINLNRGPVLRAEVHGPDRAVDMRGHLLEFSVCESCGKGSQNEVSHLVLFVLLVK